MHIIYFSFMFLAYAPRTALLCRGSTRSRGHARLAFAYVMQPGQP